MMEVGRGGFSSLVLCSRVLVEFSDSETLNISLTKHSWKGKAPGEANTHQHCQIRTPECHDLTFG